MRIAQSWRRGWPAVPAAALLYGVWALFGASAESDRVAAAPSSTVAAANPMAASLADAPAAPAAELAASSVAAAEATDALPPGVTREQWAAIEAEVSKRPDAPAELQRLHAYLQWSDALRRFREAPAADRAALAATIEQGLAERIRQGEVSAGEARQIESALLALTVGDDTERVERLRQWAATELAAGAAADPRQAAFERRQAEIVAAWSAQPASARDPAALERELEALRRQSFAPAGAR